MNVGALYAIYEQLKKNKYIIYRRPYELNIVGIRSAVNKPNKYDDVFFIFYYNDKGQMINFIYPCTTDPGTYWLNKPMNRLGTAAIKAGQYINSHAIGIHRGYTALTQIGKLKIFRDLDRNNTFDFITAKEYDSTGDGINIHRASTGDNENVDRWSAGCQVFKNATDFKNFMIMAQKHKRLYGNKFTYTLIDERANAQNKNKNIAGIAAVAIIGLAAYKLA